MEKGNGKREMILNAALDLFSVKGYDGVGVDEIGSAVGIKGPALYYYFKSKEALLDALIEKMNAYYEARFIPARRKTELPANMEELVNMSMEMLDFTIHDEQIIKVRRMLAMEQFRNGKLRALTTKHHLTGLEEIYTGMFRHLIELGRVKPFDPGLLAGEFTAYVTMMVHLIDREPEKETEAMERIRRHMIHFSAVYGM